MTWQQLILNPKTEAELKFQEDYWKEKGDKMKFFAASDNHVTLSEIFFWIVIWSETLTFHLK